MTSATNILILIFTLASVSQSFVIPGQSALFRRVSLIKPVQLAQHVVERVGKKELLTPEQIDRLLATLVNDTETHTQNNNKVNLFGFLGRLNPLRPSKPASPLDDKKHRENVDQVLRNIEEANKIKIIYACETGAREWLPDAQHTPGADIRFIYVQKDVNNYFTFPSTNKKPQLDSSALRSFKGQSLNKTYYWQGFDVLEALKLLGEMNPYMVEMIHANNVYRSDRPRLISQIRRLVANQQRLAYLVDNYRWMSANILATLEANNSTRVNVRNYLSIIRPALMAEWIVSKHNSTSIFPWRQQKKLVEADMNVVLRDVRANLPEDVYKAVQALYCRRKVLGGLESVRRSLSVDAWLLRIIEDSDGRFERALANIDDNVVDYDLDNEFDSVVGQIFKS